MLTLILLNQSFFRTFTLKKKEVIGSLVILNERSIEHFNMKYRILNKEKIQKKLMNL